MIKYVTGDLIQMSQNGDFNVVVHGCNCFNVMGAGVARQIKETYPTAYEADLRTVKGDVNKLGDFTRTIVSVGDGILTIINGYTQYGIATTSNRSPVDYEAIELLFSKLDRILESGLTVGMPRIGSGLAGGDWERIESIIYRVTPNLNIVVVDYKKYY